MVLLSSVNWAEIQKLLARAKRDVQRELDGHKMEPDSLMDDLNRISKLLIPATDER